jgi:hypothetical protein
MEQQRNKTFQQLGAEQCKFQQLAEWQWAGQPWVVPVARLA